MSGTYRRLVIDGLAVLAVVSVFALVALFSGTGLSENPVVAGLSITALAAGLSAVLIGAHRHRDQTVRRETVELLRAQVKAELHSH